MTTTTKFPMTSEQFLQQATPLTVNVCGATLVATPRQFSTGSVGFYCAGKAPGASPVSVLGQTFVAEGRTFGTGSTGGRINGKLEATIGGVPVKLQVSGNLVECGSKNGKPTGIFQVGISLVAVGSKPDAANAKAAGAAAASIATETKPAPLPAPRGRRLSSIKT